jgi:hypothetical protein
MATPQGDVEARHLTIAISRARAAVRSSRLAPFPPGAAGRAIGRSPPTIRVALRVEPEAVTEQQPGDEG